MAFNAFYLHHQEARIIAKEDKVSYCAFSSLVDDVEPQCLVRECRELEEYYKADYTSTGLAAELEDRHSVVKEMVEVICSLPHVVILLCRSMTWCIAISCMYDVVHYYFELCNLCVCTAHAQLNK